MPAILLRKAADQAGPTALLSAALEKEGTPPLLDRGTVLVSLAAAIALGATSMSDIALLAHLAPVLGDAPSGPTIRWTRARVDADRGHPCRVPVAGHRGQGPDGLAGHRHGRDPGHRALEQGGSGPGLEEGL
jgi:hypothetical protein